jgi:hypothetical protein
MKSDKKFHVFRERNKVTDAYWSLNQAAATTTTTDTNNNNNK